MSISHNLLSGWQPKDIVSAVIALSALTISFINFRLTRYLARRAYTQAFGQDISKWAADGLTFYRDFEKIILSPAPDKSAKDAVFELRSQADYLLSAGILLLPLNHPLLITITATLVDIETFLGMSQLSPEPISAEDVRKSRATFLGEARKLIGTLERFKLIKTL